MPPIDPAQSQAFGRAHPAIAERLASAGADPEIERVVEGFGELAARVERVLDATAGRAVQHFAAMFAPEILQPFPAATILELTPNASLGRVEVDAGAEFDSVSVEGVRCRFAAHAPFAIVPWRVTEARAIARESAFEITLTAFGAARPVETLFPLRLHAAGSARAATQLLAWLHEHAVGASVRVGDRAITLAPRAVRSWGTRRDEALLPGEPGEHPGARLLREWLILPAKLAFFEVAGDARGAGVASRVTLRVQLDAPLPANVGLDAESLRTNCVPVANVFACTTDPVRPSLEQPAPQLRVAGFPLAHAEVFGVTRVTALLAEGGPRMVPPMTAFTAVIEGAESAGRATSHRYALERARSIVGEGSDVAISVHLPAGSAPEARVEVLSIDAWATNRALPSSLGVGDVRVAAPTTPRGVTFRNLRAITPYRSAPHGDALARRALALAALSARPLARVDSLRALLHALDLSALADAQASRALVQRLEAIVDVTSRPVTERVAGVQARGRDVALQISETGFDGEGEAFAFAAVLAATLAHEASLDTFVRARARLTTTGRAFVFAARNGDEELA